MFGGRKTMFSVAAQTPSSSVPTPQKAMRTVDPPALTPMDQISKHAVDVPVHQLSSRRGSQKKRPREELDEDAEAKPARADSSAPCRRPLGIGPTVMELFKAHLQLFSKQSIVVMCVPTLASSRLATGNIALLNEAIGGAAAKLMALSSASNKVLHIDAAAVNDPLRRDELLLSWCRDNAEAPLLFYTDATFIQLTERRRVVELTRTASSPKPIAFICVALNVETEVSRLLSAQPAQTTAKVRTKMQPVIGNDFGATEFDFLVVLQYTPSGFE